MPDTEHTESRHQLPFEQHHAFIIGIDEYKNILPLQTAVNDARKLGDVLSLQQHFHVHDPLLNATREEIQNLLTNTLRQSVEKNDRVVLYFAGHGIALDGDDGPTGYIVPADADPNDAKTFIPMNELQQTLNALPCRHLLLILDCCFSGAFKWSSKFRAFGSLPKRIYKERFDRFVEEPAWQAITSAAYDQKALDVLHGKMTGDRGVQKAENNTLHSPFALALFSGLAGDADTKVGQEGDGVITATELYSYIRDQVEPATIEESQRLRQTPGFFPLPNHDKGEFIFLHPRHRLNLPPLPDRSPYKGLQPFEESDKELFYGRADAIKKLLAKVESNELVVVCGASGTGKSSLVMAGLLPELRERGFAVLPIVRPGEHPTAALDQALLVSNSGQKSVLVVDQFEEVVTRCSDPVEQEKFVAKLRAMLDEQSSERKVILSVRADFEFQFRDGVLKEYWNAGMCNIEELETDLREVVVGPTLQEVLLFDPPKIVDGFIEKIGQAPGALPLLSYALSELYKISLKSGRQDRALKEEDYNKLGGVIGAVLAKADASYQSLDVEAQNTMRKIMLRMVSLEDGLASKRVSIEELKFANADEDQRVHSMVNQLVAERLIVKGKDYIELAHDALLREWKTSLDWIHTIGEEKLTLNAKLNAVANDFARSLNVKFLWNEHPHLRVLQQELLDPRQWFNANEIRFIEESVARRRKLKRIARAITAGVIIALSALTVWALVSRFEAILNFKKAKANLLAINAGEVLESDNTLALRVAEASYAVIEEEPPIAAQQILAESFHTLHEKALFYESSLNHDDEVTAIAFSPLGDRILTGSRDGTATLWDARGSLLKTVNQGEEKVTLARFSPSGKMILTATLDGTIIVWNANGAPLDTIRHEKEINAAAFSPDEGFLLTACADNVARLWNVNGTLINSMSHSGQVFSAVFDSAGQKIVTASADGTVKLWDRQGNFVKAVAKHRRQVNNAVFSPDGKLILTASRDGDAGLWDLQGTLISLLHHARDQEVYSADFSLDGKSIITASADRTAKLWNLNGELFATFHHDQKVFAASFSADGDKIVTASADSAAKVWNRNGGLLAILEHQNEVTRAVFSRDGRILTGSKDGTAKLWNLRDVPLLNSDKSGQFAAFSHDGARIITTENETAKVWDVDGKLIDSLVLRARVAKAIFSPTNSRVLLISDDGVATLWNPSEKRIVAAFSHDEHEINSATFSADGKLILTVANDKTARLWEISNERQSRVLGAVGTTNSAVFSENKILTASNDGYARIWNTTGELLDSLNHRGAEVTHVMLSSDQILTVAADGLTRVWNDRRDIVDSIRTGEVESAVASPNGERVIILESGEGPARLWNLKTHRVDSLIHPNNTKVKYAAFSPDGNRILTGAVDGVARLWNLQGELVAEFDKHDGKEITSIAFSPDGKSIVTSAMDNTIKFWWTPQTIFDWVKKANVYRLNETEETEFGIRE